MQKVTILWANLHPPFSKRTAGTRRFFSAHRLKIGLLSQLGVIAGLFLEKCGKYKGFVCTKKWVKAH